MKIYKTTPYTLADFRLICDNLDFDRGLVNSAMDRATFLHAKGYLAETEKQGIESTASPRMATGTHSSRHLARWWKRSTTLLSRKQPVSDSSRDSLAQATAVRRKVTTIRTTKARPRPPPASSRRLLRLGTTTTPLARDFKPPPRLTTTSLPATTARAKAKAKPRCSRSPSRMTTSLPSPERLESASSTLTTPRTRGPLLGREERPVNLFRSVVPLIPPLD
jgi:hypothetical protein